MVAALLGAFVLLSTEVAWWNSSRVVVQGTSQLDLQRDASFVLDSISDQARGATSFTVGNYGSKVGNLVILYGPGSNELARYYWNPSDDKLYSSKNGGAVSKFIASNVDDLDFSANGKQLTMTLALEDPYSQSATFTTLAWLRN